MKNIRITTAYPILIHKAVICLFFMRNSEVSTRTYMGQTTSAIPFTFYHRRKRYLSGQWKNLASLPAAAFSLPAWYTSLLQCRFWRSMALCMGQCLRSQSISLVKTDRFRSGYSGPGQLYPCRTIYNPDPAVTEYLKPAPGSELRQLSFLFHLMSLLISSNTAKIHFLPRLKQTQMKHFLIRHSNLSQTIMTVISMCRIFPIILELAVPPVFLIPVTPESVATELSDSFSDAKGTGTSYFYKFWNSGHFSSDRLSWFSDIFKSISPGLQHQSQRISKTSQR